MPGGGDFCFVFSTQRPEFCTEKLSRGVGILTEKISGLAVSPGGMVTGQIDTALCNHSFQLSMWEQSRVESLHCQFHLLTCTQIINKRHNSGDPL